ncbi:hypothetical protein PFISCL1PPCAC_1553, partial [Pristionchus fissidentatus]
WQPTSWNAVETALHQFAKAAGVSRVRCNKPYSKLSPRGKNYKGTGVYLLLKIMIETIAQTAPERAELWMKVKADMGDRVPSIDDSELVQSLLKIAAEHYNMATNRLERVWLLSLYANDIDYHTMLQHIPGLSDRTWNEARKMAIDQDSFVLGDNTKERYDPVKLEYFISFITSPHIMISLPFGDATVKDSHGNILHMSPTVPQARIYETIRLYEEYMKEAGLEKLLLKRTTAYKILSNLPMKQTHSLTCVDYYHARATNGLIEMGRMIDDFVTMGRLKSVDAPHFKRGIDVMRSYLKGNFCKHLKKESRISDHCMFWALSDPNNAHFKMEHKGHEHKQRCTECKNIEHTIDELRTLICDVGSEKKLSVDEKRKMEAYAHEFELRATSLHELKAHLVRSEYASMDKERIMDNRKEDEAMIILDYAQRWDPERYRETQSQYFGKSGESWHISHVSAKI